MAPTIKDNGAMKFTRTQWVVLALVVAGILTLTLISRRGKPVEVVVVTQGPWSSRW
jgi:hypothetical protein